MLRIALLMAAMLFASQVAAQSPNVTSAKNEDLTYVRANHATAKAYVENNALSIIRGGGIDVSEGNKLKVRFRLLNTSEFTVKTVTENDVHKVVFENSVSGDVSGFEVAFSVSVDDNGSTIVKTNSDISVSNSNLRAAELLAFLKRTSVKMNRYLSENVR